MARKVRLQHVSKRIRGRTYTQHVITLSVDLVRQMGWADGTVDLELFSIGKDRVALRVAPMKMTRAVQPQEEQREESAGRCRQLLLSFYDD